MINVNEDIDNYIKLYDKILALLNNLSNYQNIKNILNYKNINKDINNLLNENNIKNKIKYLLNKLNENIIEMPLIYNINKNDNEIKLFGEKFVEKNKDNFILLINNRMLNNYEYYPIQKELNDKYIKLKFIQKNKINNMRYMFYNYKSLLSLPDISNWNTNKINNMSYMLYNCESLLSLPDISK